MSQGPMSQGAMELTLPFAGRWLVQNSPARRVPSHGTDLFGERYAIDFVGVDDRGRAANRSDWRTVFATEPPERFVAFGRPILAPAHGTVVVAHDGEPDHGARRSQLALAAYLLGQGARVRAGADAIAGNHVVIQLGDRVFVALVHLRARSLRVAPGDVVAPGQPIAECGNSGNSTSPHVHVQAVDRLELDSARGLPLSFLNFREWARGGSPGVWRERGVPGEGAVVEPGG